MVDRCVALRDGLVYDAGGPSAGTCPNAGCAARSSVCAPLLSSGSSLGVLRVRFRQEPPEPLSNSPAAEDVLSGEELRGRAIDVAGRLAPALTVIRLRDALIAQSIRDPLTGAFNRRAMTRILGQAASASQPLSLVMLDIDHFKQFNDVHGHAAGDVLLSEFGAFLRTHVRADDVVFRYGGEEFMLVLRSTDHQVAHVRIEALRAQWAGRERDGMPPTTFSAGIAEWQCHAVTMNALVKAAKSGGRNRVEVSRAVVSRQLVESQACSGAPADSYGATGVDDRHH